MDADSYVLQALGYKWAELKKKKKAEEKMGNTLFYSVLVTYM